MNSIFAYRSDIDGLRAVAVVTVILFHIGFIVNGYLGVDVFFVISGYLITGIVYNEKLENKFSILKFYERRIRRILPLLFVVTSVALILGVIYMLPDDLENLSQSVIASNLSLNNFLMQITSHNYWAVDNEYKPLMHTWSLGIEEQFYLLYPIMFGVIKPEKHKYIKSILISLTILSLAAFFVQNDYSAKFYFLQYRFFELSIGGLCAIYFKNPMKVNRGISLIVLISFILLILLLILPIAFTYESKIFITIIFTSVLLVFGGSVSTVNEVFRSLISNKTIVFVGKISFGLYLWHQLVFAFSRYVFFEKITLLWSVVLILIVFILSVLSYYFIETPFRDKKVLSFKYVLITIALLFISGTGSAFYIYRIGGIIKDYACLDLFERDKLTHYNSFNKDNNIHIQYNEDVNKFDRQFEPTNKIKVLVIGNSFGRDAFNILNESEISDCLEIRYLKMSKVLKSDSKIDKIIDAGKIREADFIFFATKDFTGIDFIKTLENKYKVTIDWHKFYVFGTKDFGFSNGIFYNKIRNGTNAESIKTETKAGVKEINNLLTKEWGTHYIDLLNIVTDENGSVRVLTPEGKFISQDTMHLTKSGAKYYALLLNKRLRSILNLH